MIGNATASAAVRRAILWRIHFWCALIATPFTLVAALTGILYVFTPQIQALRYAALDHVAPVGAMRPLDDAVAAARAATPPGWRLQTVFPPFSPDDSVKALFDQRAADPVAHEAHGGGHVPPAAAAGAADGGRRASQTLTVYVDPYDARVLGAMTGEERFGNWAKKLHSRLLQDDGWRWMIELAASAMTVMLVSGLLLWWPATPKQVLPRVDVRGRGAWKQWHGLLGAALALLTVTILATGLTWSKYAGTQIRTSRDFLGQAPPRAPADAVSAIPHEQAMLTWQQVWELTRSRAPAVSVQIEPPRGLLGVWRMAAADPGKPTRRFDLLLDRFSGRQLYYAGWDQQTVFGKATAIGIPFHRGEFGWWNQALLLLFGVGVLFSLLSGWLMFIKRWRPGLPILPKLPSSAPATWKAAAIPMALAVPVFAWVMPLAGLAAAVIAACEFAASRREV